jgi:SNF2 family DNA or RNA helicase
MVEAYIKHYATDIIDDKIYMDDEDKLFAFMKDGLPYLASYCQIFVSEALSHIGTSHSSSISVGVSIENNLLEIELDSVDINQDEIFQVLASYRKKRKFHRLKNGKLIYLDSQDLSELDDLTTTLHLSESDFKDGKADMSMYRVFELEAFSKDNNAIEYKREDNVTQFLENFNRQNVHFDLSKHYEPILRDYQKEGYQWLKLMAYYGFGGILADDMGLGKTLQMIAYLDSEKDDNRVSMVITPASLLLNWEDEIHKFSTDLKCLPIYGSKEDRNELIKRIDNYDVIITSYDYLRRDIEELEKKDFYCVVLDEAQYIKNQKTKNAICVKRLKSEHRFALTGTPIENSLAELWSIFDFLMPKYLYNYHYFSQQYEKPIVKFNDETKQARLQNMISPFLLRRNKSVVLKELPPKIEKTLTFTFNEEEKKLYYANMIQVHKELATKYNVESNKRFEILAMLTRLRQLCLDPRLVYEDIEEPSSKIKGCIELLHSLKDNNKKVLLFSSFTSVLDLLGQKLKEEHISYYTLTGSNSKEERQRLVNQFQNDSTDVFLISLKAGGTGLNLTAAEAVIHFDPWWNMSAQNQATDRAYRIGQNKSVQVFKLIMKDSIEEKIQNLQELKKNLADTFIEEGKTSIQNMSMEDILALFND